MSLAKGSRRVNGKKVRKDCFKKEISKGEVVKNVKARNWRKQNKPQEISSKRFGLTQEESLRAEKPERSTHEVFLFIYFFFNIILLFFLFLPNYRLSLNAVLDKEKSSPSVWVACKQPLNRPVTAGAGYH